MAEVTVSYAELENGDLPLVCMQCGSRRGVDFVNRRFQRLSKVILNVIFYKRVRVPVPLCGAHAGFYFMIFWKRLGAVAITADQITFGRVHEDFVKALRSRRAKQKRGEAVEYERPPGRVVLGRDPAETKGVLKVLGIVAVLFVGLTILGFCSIFGLMGLMFFWLKTLPPAAPSPAITVAAARNEELRPQCVVVGLLAAAPSAGLPGALPWAALAQNMRKDAFNILEDAELNKLLRDLQSPQPTVVQQAAKRLAQATPDEARRQEIAKSLEAVLTNPFPMARDAAAEALGQWGTAENEPALTRMLGDPFPSSRGAAAGALAAIKNRR